MQTTLWVVILNVNFTVLAMFHLAYLGLMFGSQSPEERDLELQVNACSYTLLSVGAERCLISM